MINLTNLDLTPYRIEEVDSPLYESFIIGLQEIYWCENHLIRTLLKLENGSIAREVRSSVHAYLESTKRHIYRLDQMFELLDEETNVQPCDPLSTLCQAAEDSLATLDGALRDERILVFSEKLINHELRGYQKLIELVSGTGRTDIEKLLIETLDEETKTHQTFTGIMQLRSQKISAAA
ncbi:MAG: DUF892 family protein [Chryseolinea sp.]